MHGTAARSDQTKPRVFITDSTSWEISGGWGASGGTRGGSIKGGARPQTAEIIKTFGQRCPEIVVNNRKDLADYVVVLDHEGRKGVVRRRNKTAVFRRDGDSIFSESTRSLGNSVKDACSAIVSDFKSNPPAPAASAAEGAQAAPVAATVTAAKAYSAGSPVAGESSADPVNVAIKSTPEGADITVDGKFVGSAPSALKLPSGDHTISVNPLGFKPWQRAMTLSSGSSVTLNATLEKTQ